MATAAVKRYWSRVVAMGCIICGSPAEIAHCHGGSIVERMQEPKAKGKKLARYDWLVLPLCPTHHRLECVGLALDANPKAWEECHGEQATLLDLIGTRLGVDVWKLANEGRK